MNNKVVTALAVFCFIAVMAVPMVDGADTGTASGTGYVSQLDQNGEKVFNTVSDRFEAEIEGSNPMDQLIVKVEFPYLSVQQTSEEAQKYALDVVYSALTAIYYTDAEAIWLWDLPISAPPVTVEVMDVTLTSQDGDSVARYAAVSATMTLTVPSDFAQDPDVEGNEIINCISAMREARFEVSGTVPQKVQAIADRLRGVSSVDDVYPVPPAEGDGEGSSGETTDGASEEVVPSVSNAYDALVERKSSTAGVAMAFTYLCQYNGVEACTTAGTFVESESEDGEVPWFWNLVCMDDAWYACDVSIYDGEDRSSLMAGTATAVIGGAVSGFGAVHVTDLDLSVDTSLHGISVTTIGYQWPDDRTFLEKWGAYIMVAVIMVVVVGVMVMAMRKGEI